MLPILTILFVLTLLTALVTVMSVKPLQSIVKSGAIAIAIAGIIVLFVLFVGQMGLFSITLTLIAIVLILAMLVSIYNVVKLIRRLLLNQEPVKRDAYGRIILYSIIALFGSVILIPKLIPYRHAKDALTKANMHTLQMCVEDFSGGIKGSYPSHLNTRVLDVLKDLNAMSLTLVNDSSSVTGYSNSDTIFAKDIGTTGPSLLPAKGNFKNAYGNSKPVLIFSKTDPPVWDKKCIGVIYYVPIDVKGHIAKRYKIYGAGKKGLIPIAIQSDDMPKDN